MIHLNSKIPFNEFCFLIQTRDTQRAFYWLSWILAYAREQKKRTKQAVVVAERKSPYYSSKYARHLIWMIRDVVNAQSNTYVEALFKLYCLRWEPGTSRAKQTFLLTAILFVTEPVDSREPAKRD